MHWIIFALNVIVEKSTGKCLDSDSVVIPRQILEEEVVSLAIRVRVGVAIHAINQNQR